MRPIPVPILASRVTDNTQEWRAHRKAAKTVIPCFWADECQYPHAATPRRTRRWWLPTDEQVIGFLLGFGWGTLLTTSAWIWATS